MILNDYKEENQIFHKKLLKVLKHEEEIYRPSISNPASIHQFIRPDKRIGDTEYKFEWGNRKGNMIITSNSIFKMNS